MLANKIRSWPAEKKYKAINRLSPSWYSFKEVYGGRLSDADRRSIEAFPFSDQEILEADQWRKEQTRRENEAIPATNYNDFNSSGMLEY